MYRPLLMLPLPSLLPRPVHTDGDGGDGGDSVDMPTLTTTYNGPEPNVPQIQMLNVWFEKWTSMSQFLVCNIEFGQWNDTHTTYVWYGAYDKTLCVYLDNCRCVVVVVVGCCCWWCRCHHHFCVSFTNRHRYVFVVCDVYEYVVRMAWIGCVSFWFTFTQHKQKSFRHTWVSVCVWLE